MIEAAHIKKALQAVPGALGGQMRSLDELAAGANDALLQAPAGLTAQGAAAFLATMAQESAWFRTTEEYAKNGRYAPYIGRTFEQVTWKTNYREFGKWCHAKGLLDDAEQFVKQPKALAEYRWAWLGGVWYFEHTRLWDEANAGDFLGVQKGVNLGNPKSPHTPAGWSTRKKAYDAFRAVGEALLPAVPPAAPAPIEEAPVATQTIDGTTYTLRSSKHGTYVLYQNEAVDPGDLVRLLATTAYAVGKKLRITQGGLSDGSLSGNTHLRLGAYDIDHDGWSKAEVWRWCQVAMLNGIRPFPRGFIRDSFQGKTTGNINDGNEHLHVLVGKSLYPQGHPARYQQVEYDKRGDGLVGSTGYTGPWAPVSDWSESPYNPANRIDGPRQFVVNVATGSDLLGLDAYRKPVLARESGQIIDAVAVVRRWGRDNALTASGNFYALQYLTPAA